RISREMVSSQLDRGRGHTRLLRRIGPSCAGFTPAQENPRPTVSQPHWETAESGIYGPAWNQTRQPCWFSSGQLGQPYPRQCLPSRTGRVRGGTTTGVRERQREEPRRYLQHRFYTKRPHGGQRRNKNQGIQGHRQMDENITN